MSEPGEYVVVHGDIRGLKVMDTPNATAVTLVKRLPKESVVVVEEILETDDARVRGKIEGGWITMMDLADHNRFVLRKKSEQSIKVTAFLCMKSKIYCFAEMLTSVC